MEWNTSKERDGVVRRMKAEKLVKLAVYQDCFERRASREQQKMRRESIDQRGR